MMRGINHQNIFEELEDYYQFIATLDRMRVHYDEEGSPSGINWKTVGTGKRLAQHLQCHLREVFYNDAGEVTEVIDLAPNSDCVALNIPLGQWHTVEVLESGTIIMETKDGAYEPLGEDEIWNGDKN